MERIERTIDTDRGYHIFCLDGSIKEQKAIILCLHGFAGSKHSHAIEMLHRAMSPLNIGTFTFDWPAHGESDARFSDLTVENCLKDLDIVYSYVRERYGAPQCFATSFGGFLAMLYHKRNPEAFNRIMLRSPALKMGRVMETAINKDKFRGFLDGETVDFGHEKPLLLTRSFYDDVSSYDVFNSPPPHPERIQILHGDSDTLVPVQDSKDYAGNFGISLHLLKNAGHYYDNPGDLEWVMEEAGRFFTH